MHNQEIFSLVLISGLLSNECLWQHQVKYLSEIAAISVVNPNQDSPDKMIKAILEAAPPKFALAGHSMGGWLCFEILRVAPSRVSKVCLLNTTARDDSLEKKARRQAMIERCRNGQFEEVISEIACFFTQNHHARQEVKNMFLNVGCETFIIKKKQ
jgi:pimeloyl-ACP methyl ester carboxylesterase